VSRCGAQPLPGAEGWGVMLGDCCNRRHPQTDAWPSCARLSCRPRGHGCSVPRLWRLAATIAGIGPTAGLTPSLWLTTDQPGYCEAPHGPAGLGSCRSMLGSADHHRWREPMAV